MSFVKDQLCLFGGGTAYPDRVKFTNERMSSEKVIEAVENFFKLQGVESSESIEIIREASQRSSRTITY